MKWLEERLSSVNGLATRGESEGAGPDRLRFISAVQGLLEELAARDGVRACFACYDGLVLERAGAAPDFDALSAMTQACAAAARKAAGAASLGGVQQMVIVGSDQKLALFVLDHLEVGVVAGAGVQLAAALAR